MIALLEGTLVHKDMEGGVILCHGVGYGVSMSLATLLSVGPVGSPVQVHVHTHVGADVLRLYAFAKADERRAFVVLMGTSGVGPRLALAILSTLSPDELGQAVAAKDRSRLTRIPGVGPKKADRLLLELADRIAPEAGPLFAQGHLTRDVAAALTHLGFAPQVADEAAQAAHTACPGELDVATLVRHALRWATQKPARR